jgi:magnesium and cobalt transporter
MKARTDLPTQQDVQHAMSDDNDIEGRPGSPRAVPEPGASEAGSSPSSLVKSLRQLLNKVRGASNTSLEESVAELMEERASEGATSLGKEERALLHNLFAFSEKTVDDVMIPRTDIIAVESSANLSELQALVAEHEHTRMPVYTDKMDNIEGFIHIKDLIPYLGARKSFSLERIIRKVLFVPPSMRIVDLLAKMRSDRVHMALVTDEYGGIDGLVTIEDLVEEIVGEIKDEHDTVEEADLVALNDHTLDASARLPIEKLEERLGLSFLDDEDEDDFDTLGGLIFSLFGYVPKKGERIMHPNGVEFEVADADPRKVTRVLIHYLKG